MMRRWPDKHRSIAAGLLTALFLTGLTPGGATKAAAQLRRLPGRALPTNPADTADPVRTQSYLQLRHLVDCDSQAGDNLSARICANLAYQHSDSLLTLTYDSLLTLARSRDREREIIALRQSWQKLRDAHCRLAADGYEGHSWGIIYLTCLREMTDNRRRELQSLKRAWSSE